jgi:hypothetical protein
VTFKRTLEPSMCAECSCYWIDLVENNYAAGVKDEMNKMKYMREVIAEEEKEKKTSVVPTNAPFRSDLGFTVSLK